MPKSSKTQRLRENMRTAIKQSKQKTLDSLPTVPDNGSTKTVKPKNKKQITITEISTVIKEDELALKVGFQLLPSRTVFSRIAVDLYFDKQQLNSTRIRVLQGPLATNETELTPVLNMKGIAAGSYTIKVEMYEPWSSGEKLAFASKEVVVQYVPIRREDRLIKIPIVKRVAGAELIIVSDFEKSIYNEMEENAKKELMSKRDEW